MTVADKSVIHSQSMQKLYRFLLLVFNINRAPELFSLRSICFVYYRKRVSPLQAVMQNASNFTTNILLSKYLCEHFMGV